MTNKTDIIRALKKQREINKWLSRQLLAAQRVNVSFSKLVWRKSEQSEFQLQQLAKHLRQQEKLKFHRKVA